MGLYERYLLPRLIDRTCGMEAIEAQRAKVVPEARGRVLEIGFGSGRNLPHYAGERVERLFALEPSEGMWRVAERRLRETPFEVERLLLEGEAIPLEDASVDTVVVTYTLCSIAGAERALEGMRRVLRPGGRLLFAEHGLSPDEGVARWQRRVTPVWRLVAGGCHLDRAIPSLVEGAGFAVEGLETGYLPQGPRIAGYQYAGAARPR